MCQGEGENEREEMEEWAGERKKRPKRRAYSRETGQNAGHTQEIQRKKHSSLLPGGLLPGELLHGGLLPGL